MGLCEFNEHKDYNLDESFHTLKYNYYGIQC